MVTLHVKCDNTLLCEILDAFLTNRDQGLLFCLDDPESVLQCSGIVAMC